MAQYVSDAGAGRLARRIVVALLFIAQVRKNKSSRGKNEDVACLKDIGAGLFLLEEAAAWKFDLSHSQRLVSGLSLLARLHDACGYSFPEKERLTQAVSDTTTIADALGSCGELSDEVLVRTEMFYADMLEALNRVPGPDVISCFGTHESVFSAAPRGGRD